MSNSNIDSNSNSDGNSNSNSNSNNDSNCISNSNSDSNLTSDCEDVQVHGLRDYVGASARAALLRTHGYFASMISATAIFVLRTFVLRIPGS